MIRTKGAAILELIAAVIMIMFAVYGLFFIFNIVVDVFHHIADILGGENAIEERIIR